jgi:hypothetical protein
LFSTTIRRILHFFFFFQWKNTFLHFFFNVWKLYGLYVHPFRVYTDSGFFPNFLKFSFRVHTDSGFCKIVKKSDYTDFVFRQTV